MLCNTHVNRCIIILKRPTPPTEFNHTPESYYQHNTYFNQAEALFDQFERLLARQPDCPTNASFIEKSGFPFRVRHWFKLIDELGENNE